MEGTFGLYFVILVIVTVLFFVWHEQDNQQPDSGIVQPPSPKAEPTNYRQDFLGALEVLQTDPTNASSLIIFEEAARLYLSDLTSPGYGLINLFFRATQNYPGKIRHAYSEILSLLSQHPTLSVLHQMALDFGRLKYSLDRPDRKLTIYDENAIANDIRAASGASFTAPNLAPEIIPSPVYTNSAPADRLKALAELRDTGAITEEEYIAQRKAIVESI